MMHRIVAALAMLAVCLGAPRAPAQSTSPASPAPELSAPAVTECVKAHDSAGLLRLSEQWAEARATMQRCADEVCPIAIRSDCRHWLDELRAALPTVLVVVERDDDGDRPVRLDVDGRSVELPDKVGPIELSPGTHRLRFTLVGYPSVELDVTLVKGEKNHVVRARFLRPKPAAPAPQPVTPVAPKPTRPVPLSTYLYGGGSILAFATSAVLLGTALESRATAREACAPGCPKARRDSLDRRLLITDLVGVAGFGLGAMAVYTYVRRPWVAEARSGPAVHVVVASDHAGLVLGGRF